MIRFRRSRRSPWWIFGVIGAFLLTILKTVTSFFQLGQVGGVLLTMIVSIGAYTLIAPFELAVGVAVLLLIHELGHVIAARYKGLPVTAPVFIPFIGALIILKKNPRNAETEAFIALGGPILGTIGATIVYYMGDKMGSSLLVAIANVGFLFNALNLLPIRPLDGGRVVGAVSRWLWLAGLVGGLIAVYYMSSLILLIVWLFFAIDLLRKMIGRQRKREVFLTWSDVRIPLEQLTPSQQAALKGYWPDHLPFITYSSLSAPQKQIVRFEWEDISFKEFMQLPRQMIVHQVKVARVGHKVSEHNLTLSVHCKVICEQFEPEGYYDVSTRRRWQFGTVYVLLALFLLFMLNLVQTEWVR